MSKKKGKTLADFALSTDDPSVYTKFAGSTLAGLLSKASALANKRSDLSDEVDLVRSLTMRAVTVLGAVMDSPDAKEDSKGAASLLVDKAVHSVATIVEKQAKITALEEGTIRLSTVEWILAEITRAIDEELGEGATTEKLVSRIKKIKIPTDGSLDSFMQNSARTEEFM